MKLVFISKDHDSSQSAGIIFLNVCFFDWPERKKNSSGRSLKKTCASGRLPERRFPGGGVDRDFDGSYLEDNLYNIPTLQTQI